MRSFPTLLAVALLALIVASVSHAQSTFATITGQVTDPNGASVAGASIEARNVKTGYVYTATSNEEGVYTLANVLDGTYTLKARAQGFGEFNVNEIILSVRENRRVDVRLPLETVSNTVDVTAAGAALIETETANLADVKDREAMRELPLTLRRAWDYFSMSPQFVKTQGFNVRLGGSRNAQAEASIDGTSISRSGGGVASGPLMDKTEGFQEFRIDVAGTGAEYATMGQISLISRAGSNEWHGHASDYYTTPGLQARNPFQLTRGGSVGHILSFSGGGPVWVPKIYNGRNRTFFFYTIEFGAGSGGFTALNQTVPLRAWREGDFSSVAGLTLRNPFNGNQPFANNRIPTNLISPVAKAIQERFYALPNFGDTNVFAAQNYREQRQNQLYYNPTQTLRVDHRFNDNATVFGRLTKVDWVLDNFESIPLLTERFERSRTLRAITLSYSQTLRPTLVNEFRYGLSFDDLPANPRVNGKALVQELGLRGLANDLPDVGGIPQVSFVGLGISTLAVANGSCGPCGWDRIQQFTDNATWTRGRHTLKMGGAFQYGQSRDRREGAGVFGNLSFSNRYSGHPYADFLLGIPTTATRNFAAIEQDRRATTWAAYVSDQWQATPRLTLTYGLRYQIYPGWTEKNGRQAIFDVASGRIVVPDGSLDKVSPLLPRSYVDVVEASQAGYSSDKLLVADKNNFAPRLSVAWRPLGDNTVVRAGFGIYFDQAAKSPTAAGVPFNIAEPAHTNPTTDFITLPTAFPGRASGLGSVSLPSAFRKDLRVPYSGQYSLTVEQQRWDMGFRLSYTGTNTRQGIYRWDINQPVVDDRLYTQKPRRFPNYPAILFADNGAGHQYHALNFEVERRMKNGIRYQAYYTLARDIGDLEDNESPENAYDRRRERAAWRELPTHRFSSNFVYELPLGKGRWLLNDMHWLANAALGGWQVSGIYSYESGNFLTPLWTGPDPTGTAFTNTASRPIVTIRPDQLHDPNLSDPTLTQWFDVGAFAGPPIGRFGTAAKGVIIGVPANVFHASLSKEFTWRERIRTKLEMLATNALNHPNYFEPNTNITQTGQAGVITRTQTRNDKIDSGIPRVVQLQLRVEW